MELPKFLWNGAPVMVVKFKLDMGMTQNHMAAIFPYNFKEHEKDPKMNFLFVKKLAWSSTTDAK